MTGGTFIQDKDRYFRFAAREDDVIVPAVYNIVGPEIEAALLAHTDVTERDVAGAPGDVRGTIVQDHVVLRPAAVACEDKAQELQDVVKRSVAPCNYTRSVIFTGALPETLLAKARPVTAARGRNAAQRRLP